MIRYQIYSRIAAFAVAVLVLGAGASHILAADLAVDFGSTTPLFYDAGIAPGEKLTKPVVVTNNGAQTESVYLDTKNTNSDGLADVIELTVSSSTTSYYSDTFSNLFAATQVSLGVLASGEARSYEFSVLLPTSTDNTYQANTMSFDICVGFSGGTVTCDNTTTNTNDSGGAGGGGGTVLRIFDEAVTAVNGATNQATVVWNTNRGASSYLVCGNVIDGPFDLSPSVQYLGYTFDVSEIDGNTTSHSMVVTAPQSGSYECRPASREDESDGFTVGEALTFTIPSGSVAGISTSFDGRGGGNVDGGPNQSVLGVATQATSSTVIESADSIEADGMIKGLASSLVDTITASSWCIATLLLLLTTMAWVWSLLANRIRPQSSLLARFFFRNTVLSVVYAMAVVLFQLLDWLNLLWWPMLSLWLVGVIFDYITHRRIYVDWLPRGRHIYFAGASFAGILGSVLTGVPCFWWPFAVVAIVSTLLIFFDER